MTCKTYVTGLTDAAVIYQKAANRGMDLPEDVADHIESCHQG